jgi:hypothetical protein
VVLAPHNPKTPSLGKPTSDIAHRHPLSKDSHNIICIITTVIHYDRNNFSRLVKCHVNGSQNLGRDSISRHSVWSYPATIRCAREIGEISQISRLHQLWVWHHNSGILKLIITEIIRPRCPQVAVDVGHLLRVPPEHTFPDEPEDEFKCTNLDVVLPDRGPDVANSKLPVLVWIHGNLLIEMSQPEAE